MMSDYFKVSNDVESYNNFGKAQPMDTLVPTPGGEYYLGQLTIGDYLFDRLGNPTMITDVFFREPLKAYRVTLTDGRTTICAIDHLWTYYDQHDRIRTESLDAMLSRGIKTNSNRARYKIPNNGPVQYSEKIYYIDPYVVGVFLGDGCCLENVLSMSNPEKEIVSEVARLIDSDYKKNSSNNYTWNFRNKDGSPMHAKDTFKYYEDYLIQYSYNKRIPYFYMLGSIEQRYSLLQGLLDTDGSIGSADGHRYIILDIVLLAIG